MFKLKQDITLFLLFLCLLSCTSNPKSPIDPKKNIFIAKPEVIFNSKNLPKQINVFYFNSNTEVQNSSPLLKGITDNYYYYKEKIGYAPELNFIDFSDNANCLENVTLSRESFSIGLLFNQDYSLLNNNCYQAFKETKGLVVTKNKIVNLKDLRLRAFNINREADIKNLLNVAKINGDTRAIIIDDSTTRDKLLIEKIWKSMDGEIVSSASSGEKVSSQKLLSEILLLEQSKIRSRKLSRIIGLQINSEPRKREDIDSMFLSTSLQIARSLKPALEYNFADNINVYLIPSWLEEEYLKDDELDLEKVIISEMPFLLNTNTSSQTINPTNKSRNYAIGYDAYELVLLLDSNTRGDFNYFGLTGLISNEYPLIQKESLHAKVKNGKLQYLNYND
jgi:hypothetical protein